MIIPILVLSSSRRRFINVSASLIFSLGTDGVKIRTLSSVCLENGRKQIYRNQICDMRRLRKASDNGTAGTCRLCLVACSWLFCFLRFLSSSKKAMQEAPPQGGKERRSSCYAMLLLLYVRLVRKLADMASPRTTGRRLSVGRQASVMYRSTCI